MNGESSLREVALRSGAVRRKKMLDAQHFAEGVTNLDGRCRTARPTAPLPSSSSHLLALVWLGRRAPRRTSANECGAGRSFDLAVLVLFGLASTYSCSDTCRARVSA